MEQPRSLKLDELSRVAVIGGGPAGSFFSSFLLDMAKRAGTAIHLDIYEPRDFSLPGPPGCNMCAGVISESLVQALAVEGFSLPPQIVQRGIDSYVLHMDVGTTRIDSTRREKRIAATFRGVGPRGIMESKSTGLDGHLLEEAVSRGAQHIHCRVEKVEWLAHPTSPHKRMRWLQITTQDGVSRSYDLVAVTVGVNTPILRSFQALDMGYTPPRTTKCLVREYYLGGDAVTEHLGDSMHTFLPNIPRLEFAALIPKGEHTTLVMLGENIDRDVLQAFLQTPAVRDCLPPSFLSEQAICQCAPRINVRGSARPYGDRIVFIGDCGVSRLYKDGIGAAYRAAKAAASTAVFQGISAEDFRRHYWPTCRAIELDNTVGKVIFTIVREIQKRRFSRRAVSRMVSNEQQGQTRTDQSMSMVLWDMFTGSAAYTQIFLRTLHPAFWGRFLWELLVSLWSPSREAAESGAQKSAPASVEIASTHNPPSWQAEMVETGALGKVYGPGEVVIRQGEVGDSMHVIQEGQLEVVVEREGNEVQLAVRGEGEFLGEMAIFERETRMATVRSIGYARVLTVEKKMLLRRIHKDPTLAFNIIQAMSRRIRELSTEVARLRSD